MKIKAIKIVVDHFGGNQSETARALGVKQQNIWFWLNSENNDIPIDLFPIAAKAIGKTPSDLRPDIFINQ